MLDIHAPQLDIGALAIRAYTAGDHNAVLDLFEGPAFYFRTYRPDLLSEDQITALVGGTDLVCRYEGAVVGLFAADPLPAGYPGHCQVHVRFADWFDPQAAAAVARRLIAGLAERSPVRRLTHLVPGFDGPGRALAKAAGFRDEGELAGLLRQNGRRWPVHYFALRIDAYPVGASLAEGDS